MNCLWTILKNNWHYIESFIIIKKSEEKYYEVKKESAIKYHKRKALDKNINL